MVVWQPFMAKAEIIKKERKMKKTNKKGFTIVELVIVIAVIAILAAVLIPTFTNVVEKANQSAALQACETEYKQMAIAAASNGTTVDESVVFCKGKYYFSLENGGMTACDSSKVSGKKPTNLANGVNVYLKDTSATLNETWSSSGRGNLDAICIATKQKGVTLYVYDEDGNLFYTESIASNATVNNGIYFWMYNSDTNATGAGTWINRPTTKEAAIGYYYFTVGTVSGIFYYGA